MVPDTNTSFVSATDVTRIAALVNAIPARVPDAVAVKVYVIGAP
jgi:hypothetical protein